MSTGTKTATDQLLVADEVWLAVAAMHQRQPAREGFSASEIVAEAQRANLTGVFRPGISVHVHLHSVANLAPNPARYRMLFKLPNGDLRLYRQGDPAHPNRNGKIMPDRDRLPAEYRHYIDWYEAVYCTGKGGATPRPNAPLNPLSRPSFIDRLSGLGKSIWAGTSADDYVSELRKGWDS